MKRVILGTIAVRKPAWSRQPAGSGPARWRSASMPATASWRSTADRQSAAVRVDLALRFEDAGVSAIIYTDIDRDGAMGGVNVDATITLAQHLTTPVIASGGVSSLDDLRELRPAEEYGIIGAIVGRALMMDA